MFVIRETEHPKADLERNWSARLEAFTCDELKADVPEMDGTAGFASEEEFAEVWANATGEDESDAPEVRFHPGHGGYVEVHFEGLGGYEMEAETLEEALEEGQSFECDWAAVADAGSGHFFAQNVVSYHEVPGSAGTRWVFELKD